MADHSPMRVTVQTTGGPGASVPLLDAGTMDVIVGSYPGTAWGFIGGPGFDKKYAGLRLLMIGSYSDVLGPVVRADSGIKRVQDLRGKRVASKYDGSPIGHVVLEAFLKSGGLTWADVKAVPVPGVVPGLDALKDGLVDAAWGLTLFAPGTVELNTSVGLKVLSLEVTPESTKQLAEVVPGAIPSVLKSGTSFLKEDVTVVQYAMNLWASAHLSDAGAYNLVETLWDNHKELRPYGGLLVKDWEPKTMFDPKPVVPYHPGAAKLYKDKGVWTPETEAIQQRLLQQK